MTQTETRFSALYQAQREEKTKCLQALVDAYNERDEAQAEMGRRVSEYQTKIDETIRQRDRTQELLARERVRICHLIGDRDKAHEVIRDLLGALGPYQEHTGSIPWKIGHSLANAKIRAIQLLSRYITEDG